MDNRYIWKPGPGKEDLDSRRFQQLSSDGQALMAAVHKYYYEEVEKLRKPTQSSNYADCYKSLYASKFGINPSKVCKQNSTASSQQTIGDNHSEMEFNQDTMGINSLNNPSTLSTENRRLRGVEEIQNVDCAAHYSDIDVSASDSILPTCKGNKVLERNFGARKFVQLDSCMERQGTPQSLPLLLSESQESTMFSSVKNPVPAWLVEDGPLHNKENMYMQPSPSTKSTDGRSGVMADTNRIARGKGTEERALTNTSSINIVKRLSDHKEIRKSFTIECDKEQSSLSTERKRMRETHKQTQMDTFCVPYKKKQNDSHQIVASAEQTEGDTMCTDSTTVTEVHALSESRRKTVFSEILSSDEILMSLCYSNGATQMREPASMNAKKKTASVKLRQTGEVKGICLFYKRGKIPSREWSQDRVIYFQFSRDKDLNFRDFWKSIMKCSAKKVCCFSKDMMRALLQHVFVNDSQHSGKSELMNCDIMDPIVGCWLLNPDNPPANFNQALQVFHINQKEADILKCTDVISQDFQHLSIMMSLLHQKLDNSGMWSLYNCVETKLTPLLAIMENRSLSMDTKIFTQFAEILKRKLSILEKRAFEAAGHAFLISSHAQLRQVLFEELKLDKMLPQKTKFAKTNVGHQTSTSEAVLNQLTCVHPLPAIVLEYRQIQKLKSTYVDGMMSSIRNNTLSTHWDQISAATGRLTSYQPNIQAIPKTAVIITEYKENYIVGKSNENNTIEILAREPFISRDGWTLLAADFQQIELRLLAHLADDATLLGIFEKSDDVDIFLQLTSQWLNKAVSEVTPGEREQTKRVVYSVMYGVGKEKLAEYLKISAENAKGIMQSFLVTFPAVNQFTRKCVEFCQQFGYTKTIFHRQRLLPNIRHPSPPLRAQSERQAVNFCVQGSAADLCKSAMLQVEQALSNHPQLKARLLVQIHDELLLEVANEDMTDVQKIVKSVMEDKDTLCGDLVKLKVPLKVSLSTGKSWGRMTHVDVEV